MFGLFKRRAAGLGKPSLDSVRFDTNGYAAQGEPQPGQIRVWHTPDGDGLGIYYFPLPPDLPANASSVNELADFYQSMLGESGGKLVELSVIVTGGCSAIRTILSVPQQPSGRSYVGSLTLPFRDFSFVVKCQCMEIGLTGAKEALLFDRSLAEERATKAEDSLSKLPGLDSDAERHDEEFPDHPVARARRVLDHVAQSLVVADDVRDLPNFVLPENRDRM